MRTAPNNSGGAGALADFPMLRDRFEAWRVWLAEADWTPWLIIGFAALVRFFLLGIKPPHFDEGINGWFVDQMVKNGFYKYDPTNYHGPLHFYVLFLSQTLLGRNLWALRLPVVLVSIASVWMAIKFEPLLGRSVSRVAALAMAVSPGFVFYGRYSIHEVWLVLFSMMFILGLLGLWRFGTSNYLWWAGIGLAGMILTKETYIIHVGCALLAIPISWLSSWRLTIYRRRTKEVVRGVKARWLIPLFIGCMVAGFFFERPFNIYVPLFAGFCALVAVFIPANVIFVFYRATHLSNARPVKQTWDLLDLAMVVAIGTAAVVFFYTGTFFHWSGMKGLYQAYAAWFATGSEGRGHEKPLYYWLMLMARYELPVLAGLLVCLFCQLFKNISLRYLAIYGVGTLIAYSIVSYKTPWCIISFAWPFYFIFGAAPFLAPLRFRREIYVIAGVVLIAALGFSIGYGIYAKFWHVWPFALLFGLALLLFVLRDRIATYATWAILLCASLGSTIWLNYFRCTTDTEPYVYVQTYNDIYKLTEPLLKLGRRDPVYYGLNGYLVRTSSYPLPWILGDFYRIGYYERGSLPEKLDTDFLLVQEDRISEVESKLQDSYYTDFLKIRPYQDASKVYFNAKKFKDLFPHRLPNFPAPH